MVFQAARNDTSAPLRLMPPVPFDERLVAPHRPLPLPPPKSPPPPELAHELPPRAAAPPDAGVVPEASVTPMISTAPGLLRTFEGMGAGLPSFFVQTVPSDANGDVGLNHYVQVVNLSFAVFDKRTGQVLFGPIPVQQLFSGFPGDCGFRNDGDPVVLYDQLADRWFVSQLSMGRPYRQCVAVSASGDPAGAYHRYEFLSSQAGSGADYFMDYGKFGVWPDAYYASFNLFTTSDRATAQWVNPRACALERAAMLSGAPARQICFDAPSGYGNGFLPADFDGTLLPPAGEPNYYFGTVGYPNVSPAVWTFSVDWDNPAASSFVFDGYWTPGVSAPCQGFTNAACIPQPGTTQLLESLGGRAMYRLQYRRHGGNYDYASLMATHTISAGGGTGIRWYEIRVAARIAGMGNWGDFWDGTSRWIGAVAMDRVGNIALGYSASSATVRPALRYAWRGPSDADGVMNGEISIVEGLGVQFQTPSGPPDSGGRWGDYSMMAIDPGDDCTFYYTGQYLASDGLQNWHTRVAAIRFDSCVTPAIGGVVATQVPPCNAVAITWSTDIPADSQVEYGLSTAYGSSTLLDPTLVTSHRVSLTGLVSGQTYHYRVKSRSAAGFLSASGDATFTDLSTVCGSSCVNLASDAHNCGVCGMVCSSGVCTSGTCQCSAGYTVCSGQCVIVTSDRSNCGACGHRCDSSAPYCVNGACRVCPMGYNPCCGGDYCVTGRCPICP